MLRELQRDVLRALLGESPAEALPHLDPDGVRLTALLVVKLRFERICRGDKRMEEWFKLDPEGFTEAFRAYTREVEPRAYFPRDEAAAFWTWYKGTGRVPEASNGP